MNNALEKYLKHLNSLVEKNQKAYEAAIAEYRKNFTLGRLTLTDSFDK